ncbi:MAG: replication protein RepA [Gemmatales bacterium]
MPEVPKITRRMERLMDASVAIRSCPPEQIDFLHTVSCQCGLPYNNPGDEVREWEQKQGFATLRIEAGAAINPETGDFVKVGLPYGEKSRLVLINLASEAVRTGSPIIDVQDSMTAFARNLGLATSGPQLRGLKDQIARLAASTVRYGMVRDGRAMQINSQIITAFDLWYPGQPGQRVLWPSTVRLGDEFFASLAQHAVPLDHRAIGAIAHSSLALDMYVWLAQRLHRIQFGKTQFVAWANLHDQFGQGYERIRDFRRGFLETLRQVQVVYPDARMDVDERGITLENSPPPVASKQHFFTIPEQTTLFPKLSEQSVDNSGG